MKLEEGFESLSNKIALKRQTHLFDSTFASYSLKPFYIIYSLNSFLCLSLSSREISLILLASRERENREREETDYSTRPTT